MDLQSIQTLLYPIYGHEATQYAKKVGVEKEVRYN